MQSIILRFQRRRRGRSRLYALTLLSAALLVVVTACGSGSSSNASSSSGNAATIRLVTTATAASLPMFVAQDQGFFKKQGLDTTLQFTQNLTTIPSILGRQYDIGIGVQPTLVRAASSGIDVVQISGLEQVSEKDSPILILAKPGSGINGPADLQGKRLGAPTIAGNINLATLEWLKQKGIDPKSVKQVEVNTPNMPDQLAAGQLDAAEVQEPFTSQLLKKGYVKVGYPLGVVGEPAPMASQIANGAWAKGHLDVIAKYKKGLQEAIDFIAKQPDKSYEILAKNTGTSVEAIKGYPLSIFTTNQSADDLRVWGKILASVGDFNKTVDYNSLILTTN